MKMMETNKKQSVKLYNFVVYLLGSRRLLLILRSHLLWTPKLNHWNFWIRWEPAIDNPAS